MRSRMNKTALAINGGPPVRTSPWRESRTIGDEETHAVLRVMQSGHLSLFQGVYNPPPPYSFHGGPEVQALEERARGVTGAMHVVSVNSATSGLTASVGALGLGFGDEVIVSPFTMSACAVAPLWYGAVPIFADVERVTGCLDPLSVRDRITPRTKAIIVVHQFGIPADMNGVMGIAREYGLKVIEDCAQAWGARYKGQGVGTIGDIGVFSFNVHKTIQCGEGGLCVTNDDELALRLRLLRNHGESVVEEAGYERLVNIVGSNFRMTELQAAVARVQLEKLDALDAQRIAMVNMLYDNLAGHACLVPPPRSTDRHATYYVCPLRYLSGQSGGLPRSAFARMLRAEGIPLGEGYVKPLYLLPLFQKRIAFKNGYPWSAPENRESHPQYDQGACPNAETLHATEMLIQPFLCHPQTMDDVGDIVAAVDKVLSSLPS